MCTKVLDKERHQFNLYFDKKWNPLSQDASYGHDIEGSWLLTEAADVVGDEELKKETRRIALQMAEVVHRHGYDDDGALLYEAHRHVITDDDKVWWAQAEAVVGMVHAYQLSGDPKYVDTAYRTWAFIERYMVDPVHGEWYWKVSRNREADKTRPIVEPWKCPYHNARACMEIMNRLA
jgi:cellobiose epimerase